VVNEALGSEARPLDEGTRGFFEDRFGQDLGSARIHVGDRASTAARSIHARAFTLGRDIVFDRGEYSPGTGEGRRLLAHELTHVAQQTGGSAPQGSGGVGLSAPPMVARGEKWDAFWDVGPLDALKAKELADKALAAAKKTGLPGLHNGPGDAWRHCYWNCIMTDEIGRDQAKSIADNHEKHGGGPAVENLMDSRNNWEGRECGGSSCDPCCQGKLDAGTLDVIEGGKMVPSKATPRTGGKQSDKYTY